MDKLVIKALKYIESKYTRGEVFDCPGNAEKYFCLRLGLRENEVFTCAFLDCKHRLITVEDMFVGTIDGCSVYPREIVKAALRHNAGAVVFAHNHPSGVPEPSSADQVLTHRLKAALALIDVRVLDHIIVGGSSTVSLSGRGLL